MAAIDRCYNIADLREAARRRLPRWIFEFVDRGAEDEHALAHNLEAFRRLKLRHRALVDLTGRDLGTTLFGERLTMPAAIAPTGAAGLCWYEGELALARAAAQFGIPFTMATGSTTSLEKVAANVDGPLWFQLYLWENRAHSHELVRRAQAAGERGDIGAEIRVGVEEQRVVVAAGPEFHHQLDRNSGSHDRHLEQLGDHGEARARNCEPRRNEQVFAGADRDRFACGKRREVHAED